MDPAAWWHFGGGLSGQVRDALVTGARPRDLDELIDRAIDLDNYQRERRRERALVASPPFYTTRHRLPPPPSPSVPTVVNAHTLDEEPMQVGRSQLSVAEHRRRRAMGACLYSGQEGHYIAVCPLQPID